MAQNIIKAEDLLVDEAFLAYYHQAEHADKAYWENLMKTDPLQLKEIYEAVQILELITLEENEIPDAQLIAAQQKLLPQLNDTKMQPLEKGLFSILSRWSIAAAVLVMAGMFYFFLVKTPETELVTVFGQLKEEILPDGSQVTLNANSKITFKGNWSKVSTRELWMDGEVYFQIKQTPGKIPFIVHTPDFDIEVTGTRFNVHKRNSKASVFLSEGSITVHGSNGSELKMLSGEYAEMYGKSLQKKQVSDTSVIAWRNRKFIFNKTAMSEVAKSLEDIYGLKVYFTDSAAAQKTISGILPNDNLSVFLETLEAAYNFTITRKNDGITISSR